jgi:RHS repeat-associated protein
MKRNYFSAWVFSLGLFFSLLLVHSSPGITWAQETVISSNTTWTEGTHDITGNLTITNGATLTAAGGSTVNVSGNLTLVSNSTLLLQGKNTTGQVGGQWAGVGVTIHAGNVTVENGSKISADSQGYQPVTDAPGNGPGGGYGYLGTTIALGAGYGGKGGRSSETPGYGGIYGDPFLPTELGSAGGGCRNGGLGGAGGGAILLNVSGQLTLNGVISANGGNGGVSWYPGGGSGGSILVNAGILAGAGYFSANGGNGPAANGVANGGGAGGRIAVYYTQAAAFTGFPSSTATGGTVGLVQYYGEVGTVAFFDVSGTDPHIYVYRQFPIPDQTTRGFTGITVLNGGSLTIGGGSVITVDGEVSVRENSQILYQGLHNTGRVDGLWKGLGVTINAANLSVESGSRLSADSQGYQPVTDAPGNGPGGGYGYLGTTIALGAGYGGKGGRSSESPGYGGIYGDPFLPTELGSAGGGCTAGGLGGAGGGAIFLNVTGQLTLDGVISANGGNGGVSWYPGGGSGGSILVNAGILAGAGYFSANGGNGPAGNGVANGGGAGGRIAVYYTQAAAFTGFPSSTATGGTVGLVQYYGEVGTVAFFDTSGVNPHIYVYRQFLIPAETTGKYGAITVLNGGRLSIGGGSVITVDGDVSIRENSLILLQGLSTTGQVGGHWAGVGVTINAGNLSVESGSRLSADSQGYQPVTDAPGNGPGGGYGYLGTTIAFGAGYGGKGGRSSESPGYGGIYGDPFLPTKLGSAGGGCRNGGLGGAGGGAMFLNVTGQLTLNGVISANGGNGGVSWYPGGGSGGSILVNAGILAGAGYFSANGGNGPAGGGVANGGGAGGRIAVYYTQATAFTGFSSSTATGGTVGLVQYYGEVGTVNFFNNPFFKLLEPKDSICHGLERVYWVGMLANQNTTKVDLVITGNGTNYVVGTGLKAIGSLNWDTRTLPDGIYELRAVFKNASSTIIGEATQELLIRNSSDIAFHSGTILSNETWLANQIHIVEGDLVIPSGVTLLIEPGAVVKFVKGAKIIIEDGGTVNALGTAGQPILFTSLTDDTAGGDTNLDGNRSTPTAGYWQGYLVPGTGQFIRNEFTGFRYIYSTMIGNITSSETWLGGNTYHITGNVVVLGGATLTIEPGAVIKLGSKLGIEVQTGGILNARGTVAQPIIFTSDRDDSIGGDSNQDGDLTTPAAGDWRWIYVNGGQAAFDHVMLSYGGGNTSGNWDATGMIRTNGTSASVTLSNSVLRESFFDGILAWGGPVTITNSVFTGIDRAICAHPGSPVTVTNCTLDDNRIGLLIHGGTMNVANTIVTNSIESGIQYDFGALASVGYCNVWAPGGSGAVNYQNTSDQTGINGNISIDPKYKNRENGNYRLNYHSPCIDAADGTLAPATDFMGASRYDDPRTANTGIPTAGGAFADLGAFEFVETAQSDVDLVITSLRGPSEALAGETVTLQWTISNIGAGEVTGPWHDSVYLVRDAYTNPVELFADEVLVGQGVILGPGRTHTASAQIRVPGSHVGNHHWLVKVNSKGEIFEGLNWENNSGLSASPVYIDLTELGINGAHISRKFTEVGESHWFKFIPAAGQDVLVQLDLFNNAGTSELYIGRGYMPDPSRFDFRSEEWNAPNVSALASGTSTQTYFVVAYARSLSSSPADFTIQAATMGFSINYAGPGSVSNNGSVTLKLTGGQLRQDMTYEIVDCNGGVHAAASVFVVNSSLVYATFALNGLPACSYSVQVRYQGNTASSGTPLAITSAPPGRIEYSLDAPRAIRPDREGTVTIHYRNVGNSDAMAPLMWVTADQAVMSTSNLFLNYWCPGCPPISPPVTVYTSGYFLGINHEGPAGVLPPGAGGSIALSMSPTISSGQATFRLHTVQDPNAAINWTEKKGALRPYYISSEAWEAIYANFIARVGNTISQYNAALAENATALSNLGDYEENASSLMYFILGQCGLGEINQRYLLGAFGRGRILSYEMWGEVRNGQPVLHYASGKVREFFADGNGAGSFTGVPGDTVRLLVNSGDNTWNLTEPGGTLFHFSPDPTVTGRVRLAYAQDLNGNRVTFSYTSGRPTGLATDNGDTTTYQYNAQGRISQMTDPLGRVTTYTYDASGEHLLSINTPQGTTSFTYVSSQGAAREHALQSVTAPDGSHTYLEYDGQGRLTRTSRDGGAESKTYAYDGTGGMTITNALGANTRMFFNRFSQIGRMINPLGAVQNYAYDSNHQLLSLTGEGGIRTSMSYDDRGNRTGLNSPLGASLSASFGNYGNLTGLVDPRGNLTKYAYDNHRNLNQVIYPDGSDLQFTHDGQGRKIRWVNRRGQAVQYTVNAQGLPTRKEYPDGSRVDYTYNGHRNLLTITDARGVITFTYDGTDRLTRIDYPGGRNLTYTYDAFNRRSSLTTQDGFRLNYTYNTLGRLAGLTDGGGQGLVSYTYDPMGRLARKDQGNGTYTTYEYDAAGHLLHLVNFNQSGAVLSSFDYLYNNRGLMTRMTTLEGNRDYQYDAAGQLVQVTLPGGRTIRYDYDLSGNRTGVTDNGAVTDYFTNSLDQYSSAGPAQFHYDLDGNLISKQTSGGAWTYSYDVENRLIGFSGPSLSTSFEHDDLGNRVAVVTNGIRREYQHDGGNLVGEYNGAGGLLAHYAHGLGLAARIDAAASRNYYHFDGSANTAQISGPGGEILNTYSFLPFGERLSGSEGVPNPFTFVGQFGVMDDGAGLYFMRHRFYDPVQGRFTQPDPIGLAGGDSNLYRYAGNLPTLRIDPSGLLYSNLNMAFSSINWANPDLGQEIQSNPVFSNIHSNIQHLTNPDNPISQLPFHYAQQGDVGAASAAAAAIVVSYFTGPSKLNDHYLHFLQVYSQYSDIFKPPNTYSYSTYVEVGNNIHYALTPQGQNNPAVQQASNELRIDFENYLTQQCNNPPDPQTGPCVCPTTSLTGFLNSPPFPGSGCCPYLPPVVIVPTQVVTSYDPNVKITVGYGNEGFVTGDTPLVYTIYFENKDTATAPAQKVVVTDQLSDKLDWSTVEFFSVGFNKVELFAPAGLQHYETTASVSTDPNPVRVRADFDANSGVLTWAIQSEALITRELPEDPLAGFLPPNKADCGGCGDGYVSFLVWPKKTVTSGEIIPNTASIVFDLNAPIVTDIVINTIDSLAPTTSVRPLPTISFDRFTVTWGGSDNPGGAGIAAYFIYVSEDGGPFTLWLSGTTETQAVFTGQLGHSYSFYSVAMDHLGNWEEKPAMSEASTNANQRLIYLPIILKND